MVVVSFFFDPDCSSHEEALARLRGVMNEEGVSAPIEITAVTSQEQAEALQFPGSPTIRVDGIDIDERGAAGLRYVLTCRAYVKADGNISPLPPSELIRDALRRATAMSDRQANQLTNIGGSMPALAIGTPLPEFTLDEPATGKRFSSKDLDPSSPVVVIFFGTNCPDSLAWEERILELGRGYRGRVGMVLISSNDAERFPECTPEAIAERARERDYLVPFLFDADQDVALAFGAERTPDVFVFSADRLVYHGTVDDNSDESHQVKSRYLQDVLEALVDGKPAPIAETPLHGCGIKWKPGSVGSIQYASKLIAQGPWSAEDLAPKFGYRDVAHFTSVFEEVMGQTLEAHLASQPAAEGSRA